MRRPTSLPPVRRRAAAVLAMTGIALGSLTMVAPAQADPTPAPAATTAPAPALPSTGDQQLDQLQETARRLQTAVDTKRAALVTAQLELEQLKAQLDDVAEAEAVAREAEKNAKRESDKQDRLADEAQGRVTEARRTLGRSAARTYINGTTSEMATMMAMVDAHDGNDVAQALEGQRIITQRRARTLTTLEGAARTQHAAGVLAAAAAGEAESAATDASTLRKRTEDQVAEAEAAVEAAQTALDTAEAEAAANGLQISNRQAALSAQRSTQLAGTGLPGVPAPVPSGSSQEAVMKQAAALTGIPYRWGGTTPAGFDCSGYTSYVMRQVGVAIPRTAAQQQAFATPVSDPQPGDLVFFGKRAYHVGIYAGNGMMYHSPRTGKSTELVRVYSSAVGYGRVLR